MTQLTLIQDRSVQSRKSLSNIATHCRVISHRMHSTGQCGWDGPDIDTRLQSYHQDNFHAPSNYCPPLAVEVLGLAAAVTVLASHKDSSVICRVFRIIIC